MMYLVERLVMIAHMHAELNAAIADNRLTIRLKSLSTETWLGDNVTMNHNAEKRDNSNDKITFYRTSTVFTTYFASPLPPLTDYFMYVCVMSKKYISVRNFRYNFID